MELRPYQQDCIATFGMKFSLDLLTNIISETIMQIEFRKQRYRR